MTIQNSTTNRPETWITTRDNRTGRPLYVAIPSQTEAGKYHLVSTVGCDCRGFSWRGTCRHHRALLAELGRWCADPQAAEWAAKRSAGPLADGGTADMTTRRASGNWPAVSTETVAKADAYTSIFGRDE